VGHSSTFGNVCHSEKGFHFSRLGKGRIRKKRGKENFGNGNGGVGYREGVAKSGLTVDHSRREKRPVTFREKKGAFEEKRSPAKSSRKKI